MDDLPPLWDPSALPRVLTRSDALARGFTVAAIRHRLETGRWRRVLPSVYLTGQTMIWDDRQRAALAYAGSGAVLSGAGALVDLELRAVRQRPDRLLVLVPRSTRLDSRDFVRVRRTDRLPAPDLRPGPACAPVARAVADLARERRRLDDVRALVTEVVRRRLCTVDELHAELVHGPRRNSAFLRSAIDEAGAGAWSAPEARAQRLLRASRYPDFEPNARISLADGTITWVDFLWPRWRAALEIDSIEFHGDPADADATDERDTAIGATGLRVAHRRPFVVNRAPQRFVAGIESWLDGLRAIDGASAVRA